MLTDTGHKPKVLVVACGALARELLAVFDINGLAGFTLECLPGDLHMTPDAIVDTLGDRLRTLGVLVDGESGTEVITTDVYDRVLVGYGDCGTGGRLDEFCARHQLDRLPGDHCYQFFAGHDRFLALHNEEPGTFYLTDYLARHFDLFVTKPLGLDRHPDLVDMYFGNYRRLVYLRQVGEQSVVDRARRAADRLGLRFQMIDTGYGELTESIVAIANPATSRPAQGRPA